MMPIRPKRLHWRSALLTALRLRKTGGLVENEILEALKITLLPPTEPVAASSELINKIRSYLSSEETISLCKYQRKSISDRNMSPAGEGRWNCIYMLQYYEDVRDRAKFRQGYWIQEPDQLRSPRIKQRGRSYSVHIETNFTVQYGHSLPYRMCAIVQPRHPGMLSLSGLELLSLLLLAIKCHENNPDEPFYTVRVFAVDSSSVRRLSARVPSAYICALLQTANKATGGEPVEEITVEQTRYFDLSNDQELEGLLTALLEDDDQIVKEPEDLDPDYDYDWLNIDTLGLRSLVDEYEKNRQTESNPTSSETIGMNYPFAVHEATSKSSS